MTSRLPVAVLAYAAIAAALVMAVHAGLFGLLARSFLGSESGGALAVAAFVVHPSTPYSAVAWITNQMHVLQLLVVLSALLWWCAVRRRGLVWWTPLLAFQAAAFMVKEDGVMLVPVILALHWLRRAIAERDLPHPPWPFIAIAAAIGGGLLYYRDQVLHGLGGYGRPSADQAWSNYRRGFESVFRLVPARRPWQKEASWFVTIVPVLALACWRRCSPNVRFTLLAGIAIGALFNLPFIFVVKAQQMHLVGMGAALLITAGVVGLAQAVPSRAPRAAVLAAACAAVMAMALVSRDRITFADGAWRRSSLTLRPGDVRFWRRMHRVAIRIDRTWAPADVIPGSQDRRTLGLQVGQPSLR